MSISYYFSHDFNASDDVKMLFLRQQLGMEGVGIFWYILERLAQAGGRLPMKIIPVLSMQMQTSDVKVNAVINSFELFIVEKEEFFSARLLSNLESSFHKHQVLSESGKKGMAKRWQKPNKGNGGLVM